ncbi:MAG TPA: hypothetical protein VLC98_05935 [Phnomibacter sp.]|nr:hypothetical protein [Phnomibacter sp.]
MIRKKIQLALAASALLAAFTIVGCQKQVQNAESEDASEMTMAATESDAEAEVIFGDAGEQSAGVDGEIGLGQSDLFSGGVASADRGTAEIIGNDPIGNRCFSITITPVEPSAFPKTVTINYGTGCKGRDGRVRIGKIITVYSKPLILPGAEAVTQFDGYYVDSVKVEGKLTIQNGTTSSELKIIRKVENGKLTKTNGAYIKWDALHTTTMVGGMNTPLNPRDDEWSITGGARGELVFGTRNLTWSREITEPLHKAVACHWIDKGIVKIQHNNHQALLDFGNGTCENKATITINGVTKEITLR